MRTVHCSVVKKPPPSIDRHADSQHRWFIDQLSMSHQPPVSNAQSLSVSHRLLTVIGNLVKAVEGSPENKQRRKNRTERHRLGLQSVHWERIGAKEEIFCKRIYSSRPTRLTAGLCGGRSWDGLLYNKCAVRCVLCDLLVDLWPFVALL